MMKRRQFLGASVTSWMVACSARTDLEQEVRTVVSSSAFPQVLDVDETSFPQSVASGDPKPSSVVLWTRAPGASHIYAQVALDEDFSALVELSGEGSEAAVDLPILLSTSHDHCAKLRVDNLRPDTVYYYRFIVETAAGAKTSRVGRTKTAPEEGADRPVNFAVISCQDFSGHYHALRRLSQLEPDFVVHLGDYIYETTDDPSFQADNIDRQIRFRDEAGALPLTVTVGEEVEPRQVLAARSLDNYRQLYQTYRSEPALQGVHERAPMIAVWDDHEFANDSTADRTPLTSKSDPERRANADQAWFEYMPVDYPEEPSLQERPFPGNLRLYRDFRFGRHVHLVMTDLRRYRPPHLIAEDAFPGAVLVDEPTLRKTLGEVPGIAQPYVDLDAPDLLETASALNAAAGDWNLTGRPFTGNQNLAYVNTQIARYNELYPSTPLLEISEQAVAGRGLAAIDLGKTETSSTFGARYFVVAEAYAVLAKVLHEQSNGSSEQILGADQRRWFLDTLLGSQATWKIWGNEYTFLTKLVDLRELPVPDPRLANRFLLSVEDWDGVPNERLALLRELAPVANLAIVTGDIHSFFVGTPGVGSAELANVAPPVEFVCGAVSSATYDRLLTNLVAVDGFSELAALAAPILTLSNRHVRYNDLSSNGFAWVRATESALEVTFHKITSAKVAERALAEPLAQHFTSQAFTWKGGAEPVEQAD